MRCRLVHDEQGIALVLALLTMLTLSILTGGAVIIVSVNQHESLNSTNARRAFGIAEAGLAYAEGNLYGAAAGHDTSQVKVSQQPFSLDSGSGYWWSTVAGDGVTWTMYGQGTFDGTTRQVSVQANVPSPVTVQDTGVWNYLYSDSTSGACSTTISGSTHVSVPTFIHGNLCFSSSSPFTGSQLGVGGNLVLGGSSSKIGSSSTPITSLAVGGTCDGVTTGTGVCSGTGSPIWASHVSTALQIAPRLPPLNLQSAYANSNPGPGTGHACQVGSNTTTPFFDTNSTLDNSLGTVNLFPSSNYDCVNGSNEIRWCNSVNAAQNCSTAHTLYVNGEFFFDGNINVSGSTKIVYSGLGTIYVTGSISVAGSMSICGITNCTAAWNTANAALVFVAGCWNNSTGSQLVSQATTGTYCVNYGGSSTVQVGTYCPTDYFIAGSASNWGPVVANTLSLNGSLSQLIPFKTMPPGTPTNTATSYLPASAPTYWSG